MLYRIVRSLLVTSLLLTYVIGVFGIILPVSNDPLTGGSTYIVSTPKKDQRMKEYVREFSTDGSQLRVQIRGISMTESMLNFRLSWRPLVTLESSEKEKDSPSLREVSREPSKVLPFAIAFSKKDSGVVLEGTKVADPFGGKIEFFESKSQVPNDPIVSLSARWPPFVSLISA